MKYVVVTLLIVHALIHSMGFLQAFGITKVAPLSTPPAVLTGILWLIACVLLLTTVILWIAQVDYWWIVGGLSLLLSQALIIAFWPDAKFGSLPNLLLLVAVILGFAHSSFIAQNHSLRDSIIATARATPSQVAPAISLPLPVRKWLSTSGALNLDPPDWVTIRQELKMKLSPEQQKWYTATADQVVTLRPPAFQWSVNMRMNAFAYVYGQDIFAHESGSTLMNLWGLVPVARASGDPKTDEGALQRYLAEMVWYPMAATSAMVKWKPLDELSAQATIMVNGLSGSGIFHFTEKGDFQKFTAQRYRETGPSAQRIPWIIEVLERGVLNEVKVPIRVAVTWVTPQGPWKWLEVRITELHYHNDREEGVYNKLQELG